MTGLVSKPVSSTPMIARSVVKWIANWNLRGWFPVTTTTEITLARLLGTTFQEPPLTNNRMKIASLRRNQIPNRSRSQNRNPSPNQSQGRFPNRTLSRSQSQNLSLSPNQNRSQNQNQN